MMMRLQELQLEKRILIVEPPKEIKLEIKEVPKLIEPIHLYYKPQSYFDELPQKIKHRKKRRYHN